MIASGAMSPWRTILRREFRSYFATPLAAVFLQVKMPFFVLHLLLFLYLLQMIILFVFVRVKHH